MDEKTFKIINKIAEEHSKSNKPFGYLDRNDLKNEIWLICLDKLKDFNTERGELEHFLRVSVKNRLVNRYKDITKSVRSPCPRCPFYNPDGKVPSDCEKFGDNRHECTKWRNYQRSVESRNSLLNPCEQQGERSTKYGGHNIIMAGEIEKLVRSKIDRNYLRDLDQLVSGGKISKQRLKKLQKEINRIVDQERNTIPLTVKGIKCRPQKRTKSKKTS